MNETSEITPIRGDHFKRLGKVRFFGLQRGLEVASHTQSSPHHQENQDAIKCCPDVFFAIADGVGGGALGEVASRMLVDLCSEFEPSSIQEVSSFLKAADRSISQKLAFAGKGPGASVLCALWRAPHKRNVWYTVWVGDCRISHFRKVDGTWTLIWQSADQTYANLELSPPESIGADSPANMVGNGMSIEPGLAILTAQAGDRVVLCSDGLHRWTPLNSMLDFLQQSPHAVHSDMASQWCAKAASRGSDDDISLIIIGLSDSTFSKPFASYFNGALTTLALIALVVLYFA